MKRYVVAIAALLAGIFAASGQQRTVITGLEGHADYRALVEEEGALVRTADSLAGAISALRRSLRTDTLARAATSAAIVRLEEQGFDIRSRMARLASRINTIEQEWILENLAGERSAQNNEVAEMGEPAFGRNSPNLVYSSWFESGLSPEQLAELHGAQRAESDMPGYLAQYRARHERIEALAREYDAAATQGRADTIRAEFDAMTMENRRLVGLAGGVWESIFDSKSYLYNLLADKGNRHGMLARFEQEMERLREEQTRWAGGETPMLDYVLQKRMLTDYEIALAEDLGNAPAADSLRRVSAALPRPEIVAGLEPVALKERLFLDYSEVTVGSSPYNASRPIPGVKVWPRGVIYRILVGSFSSPQSPSIFRGAHPLAVERGGDDRYRYFAGGFQNDSLAAAAVGKLRQAGFRSPSAVVWMDGVYIDPAAEKAERIYRVEISGIAELPQQLREIIARTTSDTESAGGGSGEAYAESGGGSVDIVRGAETFMVAPLDATAAMRLRVALEELKAVRPEMTAKLAKIPD